MIIVSINQLPTVIIKQISTTFWDYRGTVL